jgi:hypothetical protein
MPDEPLDMLVVRDMPDGSFAVAHALKDVRVMQDGFKSRAELLFGPWHHRAACSEKALIGFGWGRVSRGPLGKAPLVHFAMKLVELGKVPVSSRIVGKSKRPRLSLERLTLAEAFLSLRPRLRRWPPLQQSLRFDAPCGRRQGYDAVYFE